MISNQLLTEEQVAEFLKVSKAALRRWRSEERGPRFIKVSSSLDSRGGLVRYRPEAIQNFLDGRPQGGGEAN